MIPQKGAQGSWMGSCLRRKEEDGVATGQVDQAKVSHLDATTLICPELWEDVLDLTAWLKRKQECLIQGAHWDMRS